MISFNVRRRVGACVAVLAALGVAACSSGDDDVVTPVAQTVTVVGTDTPENEILSDIYARALENSGFRVARRAPVADLAAGYASLESGAADLFVAHTGELLTYLAANEPAAASTSTTAVPTTTTLPATTLPETSAPETTVADTTVADTTVDGTATTVAVEESTTTTISTAGQASAVSLNLQTNLIGEILPAALQIGATSNAEDKPVIACNTATATGISLLSELAAKSADLRIAATADFETGDPFGLVGFEKTYGSEFGEFVPVAEDKIGDAFAPVPPADTTSTTTASSTGDTATTETTIAPVIETDADCGAFASSLDPGISTDMVVLDDDKNWITNNGVIPLMSATGYTPGVVQSIDQVSQQLTTTDLREMIRQVEGGTAASTVAGQWLQAAGLTAS